MKIFDHQVHSRFCVFFRCVRMFVFFHPCCKSEQDSSEPPVLEPSENNSRTPSEMKDNTKYDDESRDDGSRVQTTSGPSIKESLLSIKFLSICIYATIAQTRMNSIPGWTYSWLQERYFKLQKSKLQ